MLQYTSSPGGGERLWGKPLFFLTGEPPTGGGTPTGGRLGPVVGVLFSVRHSEFRQRSRIKRFALQGWSKAGAKVKLIAQPAQTGRQPVKLNFPQ